ncbi:MAG: hypothetical protein H0Z39_11340 [Peptococcaceae bacterium]|nr:hypothetical protein [Peptococcaceae bacterium]
MNKRYVILAAILAGVTAWLVLLLGDYLFYGFPAPGGIPLDNRSTFQITLDPTKHLWLPLGITLAYTVFYTLLYPPLHRVLPGKTAASKGLFFGFLIAFPGYSRALLEYAVFTGVPAPLNMYRIIVMLLHFLVMGLVIAATYQYSQRKSAGTKKTYPYPLNESSQQKRKDTPPAGNKEWATVIKAKPIGRNSK